VIINPLQLWNETTKEQFFILQIVSVFDIELCAVSISHERSASFPKSCSMAGQHASHYAGGFRVHL